MKAHGYSAWVHVKGHDGPLPEFDPQEKMVDGSPEITCYIPVHVNKKFKVFWRNDEFKKDVHGSSIGELTIDGRPCSDRRISPGKRDPKSFKTKEIAHIGSLKTEEGRRPFKFSTAEITDSEDYVIWKEVDESIGKIRLEIWLIKSLTWRDPSPARTAKERKEKKAQREAASVTVSAPNLGGPVHETAKLMNVMQDGHSIARIALGDPKPKPAPKPTPPAKPKASTMFSASGWPYKVAAEPVEKKPRKPPVRWMWWDYRGCRPHVTFVFIYRPKSFLRKLRAATPPPAPGSSRPIREARRKAPPMIDAPPLDLSDDDGLENDSSSDASDSDSDVSAYGESSKPDKYAPMDFYPEDYWSDPSESDLEPEPESRDNTPPPRASPRTPQYFELDPTPDPEQPPLDEPGSDSLDRGRTAEKRKRADSIASLDASEAPDVIPPNTNDGESLEKENAAVGSPRDRDVRSPSLESLRYPSSPLDDFYATPPPTDEASTVLPPPPPAYTPRFQSTPEQIASLPTAPAGASLRYTPEPSPSVLEPYAELPSALSRPTGNPPSPHNVPSMSDTARVSQPPPAPAPAPASPAPPSLSAISAATRATPAAPTAAETHTQPPAPTPAPNPMTAVEIAIAAAFQRELTLQTTALTKELAQHRAQLKSCQRELAIYQAVARNCAGSTTAPTPTAAIAREPNERPTPESGQPPLKRVKLEHVEGENLLSVAGSAPAVSHGPGSGGEVEDNNGTPMQVVDEVGTSASSEVQAVQVKREDIGDQPLLLQQPLAVSAIPPESTPSGNSGTTDTDLALREGVRLKTAALQRAIANHESEISRLEEEIAALGQLHEMRGGQRGNGLGEERSCDAASAWGVCVKVEVKEEPGVEAMGLLASTAGSMDDQICID